MSGVELKFLHEPHFFVGRRQKFQDALDADPARCYLKSQTRFSRDIIRHHAPDEAGKFPRDGDNSSISLLAFVEHPVIFTSESFASLVCICDYRWIISLLTGDERFGFRPHASLADALGRFYQKRPRMFITRLRNRKAVDIGGA